MLPFRADFDNLTAEFMPDDNRVFGDIIGYALVGCALKRRLMRGHAHAVGYNACEYFVVFYRGQLELLQPKVVHTIQAHCFGFHNVFSFF